MLENERNNSTKCNWWWQWQCHSTRRRRNEHTEVNRDLEIHHIGALWCWLFLPGCKRAKANQPIKWKILNCEKRFTRMSSIFLEWRSARYMAISLTNRQPNRSMRTPMTRAGRSKKAIPNVKAFFISTSKWNDSTQIQLEGITWYSLICSEHELFAVVGQEWR